MIRSRLTLIAIFLVFLSPVLASWIYFNFAENPSQKNNGELYHPARTLLPELEIDLVASNYQDETLQGFWTLLYVSDGDCTAECLQLLDQLNRVRLSTGKNMRRVRLLFLSGSDSDAQNAEKIGKAFPGAIGRLDQKNIEVARKQLNISDNAEEDVYGWVYLVDPNGNLVLRYVKTDDPILIRRDLARLLRASQIG
jgi:cytochrome oxidase Cu insertion factor (SCO1/SenC/PrrC family)